MLNSCVLYENKWQRRDRRRPSENKASTPTLHIQDAITGSSAVILPLTGSLTAHSAWLAAAALVTVPFEQCGSELGAVGAFYLGCFLQSPGNHDLISPHHMAGSWAGLELCSGKQHGACDPQVWGWG